MAGHGSKQRNRPSPRPCRYNCVLDMIPHDTNPNAHSRDPLHGVTLQAILERLLAQHGWSAMAERIPIRCFQFDPSIKSCLTFLRKTPWARAKVEAWFVEELG